ncbi:MAG: hypothetical protein J5855_08365 [Mailhella sp.]|nr:hypothetical protein [Mailhella sp.]
MLKCLAPLFMAVSFLFPATCPAEEADPLDIFAAIAADEIKSNHRLFDATVKGFSLFGSANIRDSGFLSNCNKMKSIKYLAELSSYKELEEGRHDFAKPVVVRYDNLADTLAEFFYTVGKDASQQKFQEAKVSLGEFRLRNGQIQERIKRLRDAHDKVAKAASDITNSFGDIANHKNDDTPDKLNSSYKLCQYLKNNRSMWPLKRNDLDRLDIPNIYGISDIYTRNGDLQSQASSMIETAEKNIVQFRKLPEAMGYLKSKYEAWEKLTIPIITYSEKVMEIATHQRAKQFLLPELCKALEDAAKKAKDWHNYLIDEMRSVGRNELVEIERIMSSSTFGSLKSGTGDKLYQHMFGSGSASDIKSTFTKFKSYVWSDLAGRACR